MEVAPHPPTVVFLYTGISFEEEGGEIYLGGLTKTLTLCEETSAIGLIGIIAQLLK